MEPTESTEGKGTIKTSFGNERGFSLIELVVVLVIVAVGAAFVLPNFDKGVEALRVRQGALGLAAVARSLRTRSMKEQRPFRLVIRAAEGSYEVFGEEPVLFPEGVTVSVQGGEPVREGIRHFIFFPNGRTVGGEVVMSDQTQGGSYTVRLDKISARVQVLRGRPS